MPAAQSRQNASNYVFVADPSFGLEGITLDSGRWTIGAAGNNRIVVAAPGIADQHCLILAQDGQLLLTSQNEQTWVNGTLTRETILEAGDILTLGDADFQIRQAGVITGSDDPLQVKSISGRMEALAELTEELEREFIGHHSSADQLETAAERLQACLETNVAAEDSATGCSEQTDSKQVSEFQRTLTAGTESVVADTEPVLGNSLHNMTDDPRVQSSRQTLDQIVNQFEQENLALGDPEFERQLSIQIQQQLRRLETFSESLQSRAELLDRQLIELDQQPFQMNSPATFSQQDSAVAENRRSRTSSGVPGTQPLEGSTEHVSIPGTEFPKSPGTLPQTGTFSGFSDQRHDSTRDLTDNISTSDSPQQIEHDVLDEGPMLCQADGELLKATSVTSSHAETGSHLTEDAAVPQEDALHSYVGEQRRKLQALMEEFQPCLSNEADEAEQIRDQNAEADQTRPEKTDRVEIYEAAMADALGHPAQYGGVVATQPARSKTAHQLDNSIRSTSNDNHNDFPSSKQPDLPRAGDRQIFTDSVFDSISSTRVSGNRTETTRDRTGSGPGEAGSSDNADQTARGDEPDNRPAESSVEATIDFATEQLTALTGRTDVVNPSAPDENEPGDINAAIMSDIAAENIAAGELERDSPSDVKQDTEQEYQSTDTDSPDTAGVGAASNTETPPPETHVHELRTQLAQMFDIQSPETQSGDSALDASPVVPEPDASPVDPEPDASPVVPEPDASPVDPEPDASPVDPEQKSSELNAIAVEPDAESDSANEPADSQNQFELPHDTAYQSQAAPPSSDAEAAVTETDSDEGDSVDDYSEAELTNREAIREYMEALLARNRRQVGGEADDESLLQEHQTESVVSSPEAGEQSPPDSIADDVPVNEDTGDRSWLTEGPKHSQDRDALRASLATLREVANETARSAMAQASQTQLRREILTLSAASLICLGFAVAATLLMGNPLLPLGAVGLGLYFAVRMGLVMRCSWGITRHTRKASGNSASSPWETFTPGTVIHSGDQG